MTNQQLTVDLKSAACTVTPMTARDYVEIFPNTLPISEDYDHFFALRRELECHQDPVFDHPRLYAALKCLFGESTTNYDDYKCSFGYPFLVKIVRNGRESQYLMTFRDMKGGINFLFRKILASSHELEEYPNRDVIRKPLEHDFSSGEMRFLMTWFVFYLVGFMKPFEQHFNEEFARSLECCFMIYGYRNRNFFRECYDNQEDFFAAKRSMSASGSIPFNCVKPDVYPLSTSGRPRIENDGDVHLDPSELETIEEKQNMPYVTSVERLAKEEWTEKGIKKGIEQGIRDLLLQAIQIRFGHVPDSLRASILDCDDTKRLKAFFDTALTVKSLTDLPSNL